MRIALLGTRGIPASYGGFETFAEQLSTRLASRGHKVFVYCRNRLPQTEYRGVEPGSGVAWQPRVSNSAPETRVL